MEVLQGRVVEDVREFVVEEIEGWLEENKLGDDTQSTEGASAIIDRLNLSNMLNKEQAKWLSQLLETNLNSKLDIIYHNNQRVDLGSIDELSVYADAWGLYCRPGTYRIDIEKYKLTKTLADCS